MDAAPPAFETPRRPEDASPPPAEPAAMEQRYEAEITAIEDDLLGEIEQLQRDAAARERALLAERDAYRAQLEFATSTKAWRASTTYWRARERGLGGVGWLAGQLGAYLLRVGYHLGVPYPLRRDLWYRRHTGSSYRSYFRALGASDESVSAAPQVDSADLAQVRKAVGPDILCFSAAAWDASDAQRHRLALEFARAGHRCRWVSPQLAPARVEQAATRVVHAQGEASGAAIEEITLPGDGSDISVKPVFRRSALRHALAALTDYCFAHDLREVACVVQHPGWEPMVEALRRRYGWKVIYDLAEDDEQADARLRRLLAGSDLIITSAPVQRERLLAQGDRQPASVVALNGDDGEPTRSSALCMDSMAARPSSS